MLYRTTMSVELVDSNRARESICRLDLIHFGTV